MKVIIDKIDFIIFITQSTVSLGGTKDNKIREHKEEVINNGSIR